MNACPRAPMLTAISGMLTALPISPYDNTTDTSGPRSDSLGRPRARAGPDQGIFLRVLDPNPPSVIRAQPKPPAQGAPQEQLFLGGSSCEPRSASSPANLTHTARGAQGNELP